MSENTDTTLAPPPQPKKNTLGARITAIFENKYIGWPALGIALLMPFITASAYSLNVMTTALIFVVLAAGLNIVVGYCGLLDLGYIAFLAVGAYTAGILSKMFELPVLFTLPAVILMTVLVLAAARLGKSRLGRAWRYVKEDEDAAEAMGIHTYKVKLLAYIFGAVWGGFAGILFASHLSAVSPQSFLFLQSALVLMAVVLGGMGNMKGVVIGALVISLLPELLRDFAEYRYLVFGVLLVVVMVFRPQGFWPARGHEAERGITAVDAAVAEGRSR